MPLFFFEYHARVWLRFKVACGLGDPWIPDGGIPQGCHVSMVFTVELRLPLCNYSHALDEVLRTLINCWEVPSSPQHTFDL